MYRVLGGEQSSVASSPISQKFLDELGTLASERNQRILDAKPRIPGLLWTGLLFGGVVLLGLGGFMRLGSVRAHLPASAVAGLLGLLLFVVFWLDHPFGNQLGVTSEPFEQSLSVFDSIDRGTSPWRRSSRDRVVVRRNGFRCEVNAPSISDMDASAGSTRVSSTSKVPPSLCTCARSSSWTPRRCPVATPLNIFATSWP